MSRKEQEEELLKKYTSQEDDPLGTSGVLLSDEIEYYATNWKMIDPFNHRNLRAAAYELTIGDEYAIGGQTKKLYDEPGKNEIRIPPFEVAIIKTGERLNLPRFLIGRWNLRVGWAYEGLLWVGGPQVDPGWVGYLFCPLYNLSDKEVVLRIGEPIAVIDFIKTTPFKKGKSYEYPRPPRRVIVDDYKPEGLKSALYTEARRRIIEVENRLSAFGRRLDASIGIIFTVLAIIIAALSISIFWGRSLAPASGWMYLSSGISIVALIIAICAFAKAKHKGDSSDKDNKL